MEKRIMTWEGREFVAIPRDEFEALELAAEEADDIAHARATLARIAAGEEEKFPFEIVQRLAAGENPIIVWREHRGLTTSALAEAAGLTPNYLSMIQRGKREGTITTLAILARVLNVDFEDLLPRELRRATAGEG